MMKDIRQPAKTFLKTFTIICITHAICIYFFNVHVSPDIADITVYLKN